MSFVMNVSNHVPIIHFEPKEPSHVARLSIKMLHKNDLRVKGVSS